MAGGSVNSGSLGRAVDGWGSTRRLIQSGLLLPGAAADTAGRSAGNQIAPGERRINRAIRAVDMGSWFLAAWISPDGNFLAAGAKQLFLHDLTTGEKRLGAKRPSLIYSSVVSPDGNTFALGDEEGHVSVYGLESGGADSPIWEEKVGETVTGVAFSCDSKLLAALTISGEVLLRDARSGQPLARISSFHGSDTHDFHGSNLAFTWDYLAVVGGGDDKCRIGLWCLQGMVPVEPLELQTTMQTVAFSRNGDKLSVGDDAGFVRVYSIEPRSAQPAITLLWYRHHEGKGCVNSLAFSNQAPRWLLAAGFEQGFFVVYDLQTTASIATFDVRRSDGLVCAFAAGDEFLAIGGGSSQRVMFRQLQESGMVHQISAPMSQVTSAAGEVQEKGIAACASRSCIALACESCIIVQATDTGMRWRLRIDHLPQPERGRSPTFGAERLSKRGSVAAAPVVEAAHGAVALQPGNRHVACVIAERTIVIFELSMGPPIFERIQSAQELPGRPCLVLGPFGSNRGSTCFGVKWSPNGLFLLAWGPFGVVVHQGAGEDGSLNCTPVGTEVLAFTDDDAVTTNCAAHEMQIASCGYSGAVFIRDIETGELVLPPFREDGSTGGVCWNDAGTLLAYHVEKDIVVRNTKNGDMMHRFHDIDAVPVPVGAFSPGDGQLLLCHEGVLGPDKPDDTNQFIVLNLDTKEQMSWSSVLRPCLPAGEIPTHSLGWVADPAARQRALGQVSSRDAVNTGPSTVGVPKAGTGHLNAKFKVKAVLKTSAIASALSHDAEGYTDKLRGDIGQSPPFESTNGESLPLFLYAAAGTEAVVLDMRQFAFAADDGAISTRQMIAMTNRDPPAINGFSKRFPHAINIQDPRCKDTVLHHCVRHKKLEELENWVRPSAGFTPISNSNNHTALHEAIQKHDRTSVLLLVELMVPNLNDVSSPLLTHALGKLADDMPELVAMVLKRLDNSVMQFHMDTIRKFDDSNVSGALVAGSNSRAHDPDMWKYLDDLSGTDRALTCKVVGLANFIGPPCKEEGHSALTYSSPFWSLVENRESPKIFDSKLLQLAVQYKWLTVYHLSLQRLYTYGAYFVIVVSCLVYSTQMMAGKHAKEEKAWHHVWIANSLFVLMGLTNTHKFKIEVNEVIDAIRSEDGIVEFLRDPWNFFDCGSIISAYLACAAHFARLQNTYIQQIGAIAIILDSISIIQLMRAFNITGPLIQTIFSIIWDIRGFWLVCSTILLGFTCAFIVVMPNSEAFSLFEPRVGPFFPAITMLQSMVGAFDINDYSNSTAMAMFVAFILIFAIVMLNLLIIIIGEAYNKIMADEQLTTLSLRADVIVEWEKANPQWHNNNHVVHQNLPPGRCKCESCIFPRYLHLVEQSTVDEDTVSISSTHRGIAKMNEQQQLSIGGLADRMGKLEKTTSLILEKLDGLLLEPRSHT